MPFKPLKSRCVRTSANRVFAYAKTFKWGFAPNPYFFLKNQNRGEALWQRKKLEKTTD